MHRITSTLAVLACLGFASTEAAAQAYPAKPVTIVVAYAAGGATDVIARAVAERLTQAWGRPVIIENKGGANTQIAAAYVAKAAPDGYTLLATADATFVVNPFLYARLPYDPVKDFVPVAGLGAIDEALVVHPSMPVHSIAELIALAKAKPGELNFGTFGVGSLPDLGMELLQAKAGIRLNAIQYKGGGPALTDVIAGHVPMTLINVGQMMQPWKAGELRPLGVASSARLAALPDLPTIGETVPGFSASGWFGLFAPSRTPDGVVRQINADVQRLLADQRFHDQFLAPSFYRPLFGSPDEINDIIRSDAATWGKVIRDSGLVAEE
jgi:tripartite-type tricarboxylate transporter receptor subunit TctC